MWSGKKKKNGSAEELAEETGTEKEKRKKDDKKKRDEETKESAGLFQRKSRKNTGVDADGQRPKERSVRMLHRRNKSSSASPADSAVVGGASKPTTPQSLSPNPEHGDLTRLGIKRESLSLSLNNPLLSSYPPPNTSPRSEATGATASLSGPVTPLPQLADISHKRKNSVDEVSPRQRSTLMRNSSLQSEGNKQPPSISELLFRSPITSPRSPQVAVKDISEQQKQILAQAKQRLQLELMRDAFTSEHDKIDNKHKYALALEEGDESEEMDSEQTKEEFRNWEREHFSRIEQLLKSDGSKPTSALAKYLLERAGEKRKLLDEG
jgi:hypothetical protein